MTTFVFICFISFFFFKQKTAYEVRISDWSSDVCSSDLLPRHAERMGRSTRGARSAPHHRRGPVDARFRRICRTAREALRREFSASGPAPYLFHHRRMVGRDRTRGRLYIGLLQLARPEREFSPDRKSFV